MKKITLLTMALVVWAASGFAQTTQELIADATSPEDVLTQSMGYDRKNYSPLNHINRSNIRRLVPVWSTSLMNDMGELAAPTLHNGVLYVINGKWTFAIDVETGYQIWRTPVRLEEGTQRAAVFSAVRGAATIYDGKLFRTTLDNHLVALDMTTGRELWNQRFAEWREGYYATSAPIVANGVVISGVAGGDLPTRGFLDGWDPETGEKLWRRNVARGHGRLDDGRRGHVALRVVRPGTRLGLLGDRQCGTVGPQTARGARQPVHVQRARDPTADGRNRLLFSIHAQ